MKTYAYVRVSTKEQNIERQIDAIEKFCKQKDIKLDKIFIDKASGKNFKRPQYIEMKKTVREGDQIIFKELDRLGRDLTKNQSEWNFFKNLGVHTIIVDLPILHTKATDLHGKLINDMFFTLLSYVAEQENTLRGKRVKEGMAIKKANGSKFGGNRRNPNINDKLIANVENDFASGKRVSSIAEKYSISRGTVYKITNKAIEDGRLEPKRKILFKI